MVNRLGFDLNFLIKRFSRTELGTVEVVFECLQRLDDETELVVAWLSCSII